MLIKSLFHNVSNVNKIVFSMVMGSSFMLSSYIRFKNRKKTSRNFSQEVSDEIHEFVEFLKIPSVTFFGPDGPYQECVDFLQPLCNEFGETEIREYVPGKPVLVVTIKGRNPELKSILLNGHYDVVPAERDKWNYDPFAGTIDPQSGNIYARGSQDMKNVCMQYVHACKRLKKSGIFPLERTIHLTFVPDEEIAGADGMGKVIEDKELIWRLNVGFALDEGLANPGNAYSVFYGERSAQWLRIKAVGPAGHGSRFIENTATIKLIECVNELLAFRADQEAKLKAHSHHNHHNCQKKTLGDVTTVNLTMLKAGVSLDGGKNYALNVIPTQAEAGFDVRVSPHFPIEEFDALMEKWTSDPQLCFEYVRRTPKHYVSTVDPNDPWWRAFSSTVKSIGVDIETEIFPAATDSGFLRSIHIPCYGFSPMRNTPVLMHDHDEFISKDAYLEGIDVYEKLIPVLGNLDKHELD